MPALFTLDQKPHLRAQVDRLSAQSWPPFLLHGESRQWERLCAQFARFQILLCDPGDDLVAVGHTIPLSWAGTVADLPATLDEVFARAGDGSGTVTVENTLSALAAMVRPSHRGRGLSATVLLAMRELAVQHSLSHLIAPVRPTGKARYPLAEFARYVGWTRPDGSPLDSWIRTHWKLGARQLAVADHATTVTGSLAQWTEWTGLQFPESGDYVVDGALRPVRMDRPANKGRYDEPLLWMEHPVAQSPGSGHPRPA